MTLYATAAPVHQSLAPITSNMAYSTTKSKDLIRRATQMQQTYYELLPDWFEFSPSEQQHIRNKIGFALFGPPETPEITYCLTNIDRIDQISYDRNQMPAIDKIYNKIREFSTTRGNGNLLFGILYNIILCNDESIKSKSNGTGRSQESHNIHAVPVFKISKFQNGIRFTLYLDMIGRVYKDWDDYKDNNQLPKCMMVLPKNGYYQSDPTRKVSRLYSSVWIESVESPACKTNRQVVKAMDIVSAALSVAGTVGVGAATLLTPVGPAVVAAGLVSSCVSGVWTLGRCSQQLADRVTHKESIVNKGAIPAWVGIASSGFGMGANAGAAMLPRLIAKGTRASAFAKVAFNSMVIGSLTVNGIGVAYQGCCLIEKYRENRDVDLVDILRFTSHVLFFSNAMINAKLASGFISSTQGSIIARFKGHIRSMRLYREYNQTFGGSTSGNDLGIVRGVTTIQSLKDLIGECGNFGSELAKINISNLTLLDPMYFVGLLLSGDNAKATIIQQTTAALARKQKISLSECLSSLLRVFFSKNKTRLSTTPVPNDFNEILQELSHVPDAKSILTIMFKITVVIAQNFDDPNEFLVDSASFLWNYVKTNMRELKTKASDYFKDTRIRDIMNTIVTALHDNIESMVDVLFTAFYSYIMETKPLPVY